MKMLQQAFFIAVNQVKEQRMALLAAVAISLLPIIGHQVNFLGHEAPEVYDFFAISGVGLMLIISGLIGLSLFGRDYAEHRISFYLTRPLTAVSLWLGKIAGSMFVIVSALFMLLLAAKFALGNLSLALGDLPLSYFVTGLLTALSLGTILGITFRSKSKLLLLDIALTPVALYWLAQIFWQVEIIGTGYHTSSRYNYDLPKFSHTFLPEFFLLFGLVALLTTLMPIIWGGTDLKRVHKILSLNFWSGVTTLLISFSAYGYYHLNVTPQDIDSFSEQVARANSTDKWIYLAGRGRKGKADAAFLFNPTTSEYQPIDSNSEVFFSANKEQAAWITKRRKFSANELDELDSVLNVVNLRDPRHPLQQFTLERGSYSTRIIFSGDTTRCAVINGDDLGSKNNVSIYDLAVNRLVAQATINVAFYADYHRAYPIILEGNRSYPIMLEGNKLRFYETVGDGDAGVQIQEWDFVNNSFVKIAKVLGQKYLPSEDGQYLLAINVKMKPNSANPATKGLDTENPALSGKDVRTVSLHLHDGRTGKLIKTLIEHQDTKNTGKYFTTSFLANGQIQIKEGYQVTTPQNNYKVVKTFLTNGELAQEEVEGTTKR
jgi:hypothetical protein